MRRLAAKIATRRRRAQSVVATPVPTRTRAEGSGVGDGGPELAAGPITVPLSPELSTILKSTVPGADVEVMERSLRTIGPEKNVKLKLPDIEQST